MQKQILAGTAASPRPPPEAVQDKVRGERIELLFVGRVNRLKGFERVRWVCEGLDEDATSHGMPGPGSAALAAFIGRVQTEPLYAGK